MTQEVKLKRVQCNFRADNARFLLDCDFSKQYCSYYRKRFQRMKPYVEFNCRQKWDPDLPIYNISELASAYCQHFGGAQLSESQSTHHTSANDSSFEFPKRLRRQSASDAKSPQPMTSTQIALSPAEKELFFCPVVAKSEPINDIDELNTSIDQQPTKSGSQAKEDQLVEQSSEPRESVPSECIIIGTIFKRMKLQPDVLQELNFGDFHVNYDKYLGHYVSQDDKLVLEDAGESICLVGNIEPAMFVTGIVIAILGLPISDLSEFQVKDVCYAEPNRIFLYEDMAGSQTYIPRPLGQPTCQRDEDSMFLLVLSGLEFNQDLDASSPATRAMQGVIDFIWGGGRYSQDPLSSRVARILVVGDNLLQDRLFHATEPKSASQEANLKARMLEQRKLKPYSASVRAIKIMDTFFAQLSKTIDVDVMPGPQDPTTHLLPQQPFHPSMFPKSSIYSTFNCTTNPFHAIYNDNVEIMATSGQNVDIISKFSGISDPIEIMKCHLKWGSSAPSAPDNLYSVPYEDDDPFVIDFIPDIYIAGCQEYYCRSHYYYNHREPERPSSANLEPCGTTASPVPSTSAPSTATDDLSKVPNASKTEMIPTQTSSAKKSTVLISVPRFSETFSGVLINLNTCKSKLMSFREMEETATHDKVTPAE